MADVATDPESILEAHGRTFHGFTLAVKSFCACLATIMTFLVISFCTPAGVGVGLVAAVVVAAIAIYALTHGLNHSTEEDSLHPGAHA
jgi:Bacterial aa3 type cytochrome c oxidase subunit IV